MSAFLPLGDRAFIADLPAGSNLRSLFRRLRALPGAEDVVITESRVAIYGDVAHAAAEAALEHAEADSAEDQAAPALRVVLVRYDGEDLAEVAAACGLSEAEVIAHHTGQDYDSGFCPVSRTSGRSTHGWSCPGARCRACTSRRSRSG